MRIAAISTRLRGPLAFWALAGVALLASHDAVFAVQVGPGEGLVRALRDNGHGYWAAASVTLAAAGLIAALVLALRILSLRRQATRMGADRLAAPAMARLVPQWARLLAIVSVSFVVQENAEHFISHGHLIGPGALVGPEYPLAIPVITTITLIAAIVSVLLTGAEASLIAAIATAVARLGRSPRRVGCRPPLRTGTVRISLLARAGAGRAPPEVLAA